MDIYRTWYEITDTYSFEVYKEYLKTKQMLGHKTSFNIF